MVKKGFTIAEVIVVIAVIALLTVIVFPSINNIRAKNRDANRIADITAIQLALSLYYSHNLGYPKSLAQDDFKSYINGNSLSDPFNEPYKYISLLRSGESNAKCSFYHLGTVLELPNSQLDTADNFDSTLGTGGKTKTGNYSYCDSGYPGEGIVPPNISKKIYNYNVHP